MKKKCGESHFVQPSNGHACHNENLNAIHYKMHGKIYFREKGVVMDLANLT